MTRSYLDWNATTPLRPEARAAMISAMDVLGNPSSVHSEGRAAKTLLERARAQVASALGAEGQDVIFTSGATEAAALVLGGRDLHCAAVEHDAIRSWCREDLSVSQAGRITVEDPGQSSVQIANSETGVVQELPAGLAVSDLTQGFGKIPFAFNWLELTAGIVSAHKLGGPKGIGALIVRRGTDIAAQLRGGGQEMGRRAGTENLIGIAGFGAAAEAASRDLEGGIWQEVEKLRNILEMVIADRAKATIFVGNESRRLPNTSCFITPGWKGETQVMQIDLGGFAVSAGSACSSGKVRSSDALRAMGYGAEEGACALRVSLGPDTREEDVMRFAEYWLKCEEKHRARRG
ncbi:aminotransferase [Thioclava dalianensis]|uniref:Cysteine desulfurase n=1 Tax=Thioclava dalianensis TaxID=1185766 RepID=A0A074TN31_9RHOB|nr:aminotransferase class V-fold PLP-dependent enzyme [Thioclava dalianensis]KEP71575.1 aminotransferase [Thioclava dalianensis]SFN44243.1 cysteine desulfurase [Thioclava dalianensis]